MRSEFYLEGLTCANCSEKIARRVSEEPGVIQASLSFATKKLIIDSNKPIQPGVIEQIANTIEPGIQLIPSTDFDHQDEAGTSYVVWRILGALVLFGLSYVLTPVAVPLLLTAYLLVGYDILWRAISNIRHGQIFDENFLMSIATLGAFAIREFPEGVTVMLFYQIGEYFQDRAVDHSRKSIADMMNLRVETVRIVEGDSTRLISPEQVEVGDQPTP